MNMKTTFKVKSEFNNLNKIIDHVNTVSNFECSKVHNAWKINMSSEKCGLIKKSAVIGIKFEFISNNEISLEPVVPNTYLASFTMGRGFLAPIVRILLSGKQKSFLDESIKYFSSISA